MHATCNESKLRLLTNGFFNGEKKIQNFDVNFLKIISPVYKEKVRGKKKIIFERIFHHLLTPFKRKLHPCQYPYI
jgi:hypothetical protein